MKRALRLVVFALLVLPAIPAAAQVRLAFNLLPGKTYQYAIDFDIHQEMGENKMDILLRSTYDMEVTEERGDTLTLRTTYRRMSMRIASPAMTIEGDSDKPADAGNEGPGSMLGVMTHALVNKQFTMKITREGAVLEVLGVPALTEAVVAESGLPEEERAAFRTSFERQFNEASLRESFTQSFNIYPNKVVKVGDTWTRPFRSTANNITANATYTVKAIKGDLVMLDIRSDMEMAGSIAMKGTQNGSMVVEAATGLMRNGEIRQDLHGDAVMTNHCNITGKLL